MGFPDSHADGGSGLFLVNRRANYRGETISMVLRDRDLQRPVGSVDDDGSPRHDQKRKIFEHHFVFGKLSASEIDALISYSQV